MKRCLLIVLLLATGCGKQRTPRVVWTLQETYVLATNAPYMVVASEAVPDPYHHPTESPTSSSHIVSTYGVDIDKTWGHGDGVTSFDFVGKTVEIVDGELRTVPRAGIFHVNSDGTPFRNQLVAGGSRPRGHYSDVNGDFRMSVQTGASWARLQSTNEVRVVGESGRVRLWYEAEGYRPLVIEVGYCQPPTLVILRRMTKEEPNTPFDATSQ